MSKTIFSSTQGKFTNLLIDIFSNANEPLNIITIISDSSELSPQFQRNKDF